MAYTITEENGCKVVRGAIPLSEIATLMTTWAKSGHKGSDNEWFADSKITDKIGATLVCGPRAATQEWRVTLGII